MGPRSTTDWSKIGAIAQIVGLFIAVLICAATLFFMWWLDHRARTHPEGPSMPVAWWMPALIAVTLIITGFLFYKGIALWRQPLPPPQQPNAQIEKLKTDLMAERRKPIRGASGSISNTVVESTCGAAKQMNCPTRGIGEAEYSIGGHPLKLLFMPGDIVVSERDLQKDILIGGKRLTVKRYTDTGFVVDDHGEPISFGIYVLECSG